jgi:hypothetical protein
VHRGRQRRGDESVGFAQTLRCLPATTSQIRTDLFLEAPRAVVRVTRALAALLSLQTWGSVAQWQ